MLRGLECVLLSLRFNSNVIGTAQNDLNIASKRRRIFNGISLRHMSIVIPFKGIDLNVYFGKMYYINAVFKIFRYFLFTYLDIRTSILHVFFFPE